MIDPPEEDDPAHDLTDEDIETLVDIYCDLPFDEVEEEWPYENS